LKFLLDEQVPKQIKSFLIEKGHEIITLNDLHKLGIVNGEVGIIAKEKQAIIITFDSDFLHLKKKIQQQSKIILIKLFRINTRKARLLLEKYLEISLKYLKQPGKVIITEEECNFEKMA
jgi:predicted nuclease of predicted toxin-antitoxin system